MSKHTLMNTFGKIFAFGLFLVCVLPVNAQNCGGMKVESEAPHFMASTGGQPAICLGADRSLVELSSPCMEKARILYKPRWVSVKSEKGKGLRLRIKHNHKVGERKDSLVYVNAHGKKVRWVVDQLGRISDAIVSQSGIDFYNDHLQVLVTVLSNTRYRLDTPKWLRAEEVERVAGTNGVRTYRFMAQPLTDGVYRSVRVALLDENNKMLTSIFVTQQQQPAAAHSSNGSCQKCGAACGNAHAGK